MNIVFNCPGCGAILRMKEEYGGERGRCPHCQGAITVPAIESDAGMDLLPLEQGSGDGPATPGLNPPAPAPASFSLNSRFAMPPMRRVGVEGVPVVGDSNLGLVAAGRSCREERGQRQGTNIDRRRACQRRQGRRVERGQQPWAGATRGSICEIGTRGRRARSRHESGSRRERDRPGAAA